MTNKINSVANRWSWIRYKNSSFNTAGDIANNFKNEGRDDLDPGIFTLSPIPNPARFLARECIQNTVDASRDPKFVNQNDLVPVGITFRFVELTGREKEQFIVDSGMNELNSRKQFLPIGSAAKSVGTCFDSLNKDEPLKLLYIEEHGASGMYGPWDDDLGTSKMSLAMLSANISEKDPTAGGAFGHGKSVNAMASKIRVNFGYTCFPEKLSDRGVTRRLLGATYWPKYNIDVPAYTGSGLFGEMKSTGNEEIAEPWSNEAADSLAMSLGFSVRDPKIREQCGTSMLIVDPHVNPADMRRSVERYWWPAISDGRLNVEIVNYEGTSESIDPSHDPVLKTFQDTYRLLKEDSLIDQEMFRIRECSTVSVLGMKSGDISMTPAISTSADDQVNKQGSLIAYIRGLGMVVKYRYLTIGPPYIFGSFLSNQSKEIEVLLNKSEPKTHYDWLVEADESNVETKDQIRQLVQSINRSVLSEVKEYSRSMAPPEDSKPMSFSDLDESLKDFFGKPEGPTGTIRDDFQIERSKPKKVEVGDRKIKVSGKVKFKKIDEKIDKCKVTIGFYIPDESSRGKSLMLNIKPPVGFTRSKDDPNMYIGNCEQDVLEFEWSTPAYENTWIGELDVKVEKHGE
jgi:hypothetical protein